MDIPNYKEQHQQKFTTSKPPSQLKKPELELNEWMNDKKCDHRRYMQKMLRTETWTDMIKTIPQDNVTGK